MAIIINAAWKSKKPDEEVEFKGETYTIGYDAFATIEAAVEKAFSGGKDRDRSDR